MPLPPLPRQPDEVPWPTHEWPLGDPPAGVDLESLLDEAFDDTGPMARTLAVVIVHRGRLVAERYAEPLGPSSTLISWSAAKSILHGAVGVLVDRGTIELDAPAPVAEWSRAGDPRGAITLEHLLTMRDGLRFVEDYEDDTVSDVIEMLFGEGRSDMAHFAADRPLAHPPGEAFNYSSGTSNIVARVVRDAVGGTSEAGERFLRDEVFDPIGMRSAIPKFDGAGTFVGSSYVHATARDFARFGMLYLRDGEWDGRRIVPRGWVDHARTPRSRDPEQGRWYGAHWWVEGDDHGTFWANGYEGQRIVVVPTLDLVIVRLAKMPRTAYPALRDWRRRLIETFASAG